MLVWGCRIISLNLSRTPDVVADLKTSWPLASTFVDCAVCNYVLKHLFQLSPVFFETFRCLKAGGVLLLTTVLLHAKRYCQVDVDRANLSRRADCLCSRQAAHVTSCQTMKARSRSSR